MLSSKQASPMDGTGADAKSRPLDEPIFEWQCSRSSFKSVSETRPRSHNLGLYVELVLLVE